MRKILVVLALLAAGSVVVFGARKGLRENARATTQAVGVTTVSGAPDSSRLAGLAGAAEGGEERGAAAAATPAVDATAEPMKDRPTGVSGDPQGAGSDPAPSARAGLGEAAAEAAAAEPQDPEVEEVLRRAASIYAQARSLQAEFSQRSTNPILRRTVSSRGMLYQLRPDRFLMEFSEPAGDLIVSDGRHFWVYYPSVDQKQVIRMPAGTGAGGADLQAQFVGDPVERFAIEYEGREEVAGRSAYVLELRPREPLGYRTLKVWVDAEDYLVRRFEITEDSGVVRHFELSELKLDPTLPEDLFHFTPPEGTHVVDRG